MWTTVHCHATSQGKAQRSHTHRHTPHTHISDSANCHGYKINIPLHGYTGTNASEPGNQREGFELWMTSPNMVFNLTISEGGEYEMAMVAIIILQLPPTRTCVLASVNIQCVLHYQVFSCLGLLGNVFQLLSRDPYVSNATIQVQCSTYTHNWASSGRSTTTTTTIITRHTGTHMHLPTTTRQSWMKPGP